MSSFSLNQQTMITRADKPPGLRPPGGKSCLIKIYPAGSNEGLIELPQQRFLIGRGSECQLDLLDSAVSRQHAYIESRGERYLIADMGSTNGTYVNDQIIDKKYLDNGDLVRIGTHIMKFLSSDHVEAQYHETIYSMMINDGLTGVRNKRFFLEALERELVRSYRHHRPLSLVMFDIDHFKKVNDTHGHLAGDEVLRELSTRIKSTIRQDEVFARYGGEEFAVILPESDVDQSAKFGERIRRIVADKPVNAGEISIPVTISVGVAHTAGDRKLRPEDLISESDTKLYDAKHGGRNKVCV